LIAGKGAGYPGCGIYHRAMWYVKSKGDFLKNVILTAETRQERLTGGFPGSEVSNLLASNHFGRTLKSRVSPAMSLDGRLEDF
jgi:hypothetical protein